MNQSFLKTVVCSSLIMAACSAFGADESCSRETIDFPLQVAVEKIIGDEMTKLHIEYDRSSIQIMAIPDSGSPFANLMYAVDFKTKAGSHVIVYNENKPNGLDGEQPTFLHVARPKVDYERNAEGIPLQKICKSSIDSFTTPLVFVNFSQGGFLIGEFDRVTISLSTPIQ